MAVRPKILFVDDNADFQQNFIPLLTEGEDFDVLPSTSGRQALELLETESVAVIVSDIRMPEMSGIELLQRILELGLNTPVIFVTAYGSIEQAIELVKQGAFHYFEKPVIKKLDLFKATIRQALAKGSMLKELTTFRREKSLQMRTQASIIGQSGKIGRILKSIEEVASTSVNVLIYGETGTGKDLVARMVHEMSGRRDKPFLPMSCTELAEGVLESELFGHERGAFTGAVSRQEGLLELADGATLFLDEISEASQALQSKLLRVVENKAFFRVGGRTQISSDFRLITATNRNLDECVAAGRFRQDLLYRLNTFVIELPPLRERKEDIPLLVEYYLDKFRKKYQCHITDISTDAMLFLMRYDWPGNIRELVNVVERAVITCRNSLITLGHLPFQCQAEESRDPSELNLRNLEKVVIGMALRRTAGNKARAAELLGINRKTLAEKLKGYGLDETGKG